MGFELLRHPVVFVHRQPQQEVNDVGGGKLVATVKDADGNIIGLIQA